MADQPTPSETIGEIGAAMLAGGYAVTDVRRDLNRIAHHCNLDDIAVQVEPATVFVDNPASGQMHMTLAPAQLTMKQLGALGTLINDLISQKTSLSAAASKLKSIEATAAKKSMWLSAFGGGLISGAITVLFASPWWSVAASLVLGFLIGALLELVPQSWQTNGTFAFILALLVGLSLWAVAGVIGVHSLPTFALCGPLVMLVPGRSVTNAVLEISGGDPISGGGRLVSGLMVWTMLAAGILVAVELTGSKIVTDSLVLKTGTIDTQAALGLWAHTPTLAAQWVAVLFIAAGFVLVYQSTFKMFISVTITLYFAFAVLHGAELVLSPMVAGGISAALTLFITRIEIGVGAKWPSIVLFSPAFYMLVPGSLGLVTVLSLASESAPPNAALSVLGSIIALTIGIQVGAMAAEVFQAAFHNLKRRFWAARADLTR